ASLSGVEPLMQKIHSEVRRVDASILAAVRQQSNSGTKAKEDLAAATPAVEELMYKIREIKTKAEQSETMVQEICRDINKLDFAKKHITTTITALHRLTMLGRAYMIFYGLAVSAVEQLQAVNELCSHFEAYRDVPKITELRQKFKNIKEILKSHVFSDFSRTQLVEILDNMKGKPDVGTLLLLSNKQSIVEHLSMSPDHNLSPTNDKAWSALVPYRLQLIPALQRTLEFEEELAEKFGGSAQSKVIKGEVDETGEGESNKQAVLDIRKKYEKKLAAHQRNESEERDGHKDFSVPGAGIELSLFLQNKLHEVVLVVLQFSWDHFIELEEKTLMENLEKLVQEETWDTEEGSQTNILSSSMQVFLIIRWSLKRCSALTKNQTLFNLFKSGELAENISKIIDPQFADRVDMSEVQDEFNAVIGKALVTLVLGLETKFNAEMASMTRVPWGTIESVGDQSE
ncbi:HIT domain protein, partial [Ancistrocladus abbreviatus]